MEYIVFGVGKIYQSCCSLSIKNHIVAYMDNNISNIKTFENKPIIKPSQINSWTYDYIVIFSTDFFEDIYYQLTNELNVPQRKIISFWEVVQENNYIALQRCGKSAQELINKMQCLRVLDFTAFFTNIYFSKSSMLLEKNVKLDALIPESKREHPIFKNLYDQLFCSADFDLPEYDIIVWKYSENESKRIKERLQLLNRVSRNTRYLLIILPYRCNFDENDGEIALFNYGDIIHTKYMAEGKFLIIDTKFNRQKRNIKIYTVSHKEYKEPEDILYKSIYVGKYGAEKKYLQSDSTGKNVAKYNLFINETTALYWVWKHCKEDYVGICHYRRYFLQDEERSIKNILSYPFANAILDKYDIILPQTILIGNVKEQLERHVDPRAFEEGWKIITHLIKDKQPDYWYSFEYFFSCAKIMYPCNMFVAKKEIADSYCDWLFSFILEAVKEYDFSVYDNYSQRMIGFFIERLFNVWLLKQDLKIKELPVLLIDGI